MFVKFEEGSAGNGGCVLIVWDRMIQFEAR